MLEEVRIAFGGTQNNKRETGTDSFNEREAEKRNSRKKLKRQMKRCNRGHPGRDIERDRGVLIFVVDIRGDKGV